MIYLLILFFGAILSILGPWWIMASVAYIICRWKAKSSKTAFWQSALAFISLWVGYALYIHLNSEVNMATKMAGVLSNSQSGFGDAANFFLIFGITALVALTIGGLSGLAGYKLKKI